MQISKLLLLVAAMGCVQDLAFALVAVTNFSIISLNIQQRFTILLLEIFAFCTAFTERD